MTNPWTENDAAFGPMFCDEVAYTLGSDSTQSGTIRCCAFPMEDVDPFAESDNVSDIRAVTLLVNKADWTFADNAKPSVGDRFTHDGERYRVYQVTPEQSWWRLIGRSYR